MMMNDGAGDGDDGVAGDVAYDNDDGDGGDGHDDVQRYSNYGHGHDYVDAHEYGSGRLKKIDEFAMTLTAMS